VVAQLGFASGHSLSPRLHESDLVFKLHPGETFPNWLNHAGEREELRRPSALPELRFLERLSLARQPNFWPRSLTTWYGVLRSRNGFGFVESVRYGLWLARAESTAR
jgi:hypothetical protein